MRFPRSLPDGRTGSLRVGIDATPLLGSRTGIGHYTANLMAGLAEHSELRVTGVPFTARGGRRPADLPAGIRWRHLPVPARLLQQRWAGSEFPPVELLGGPLDMFHGTNFVLPPLRRAAGVVTVHDLSYLRYPELVNAASLAYRQLVPRGLERAGAVITPTRAIAEELIDAYRLDPTSVVVTPLGVDPGWRDATPSAADRSELGLPSDYLLAVGTFEPRKGLDILVAAYRKMLAAEPGVPPLVLVGPTGWGPELDASGIPAGRLICPGYVPYDKLRGLVAGATVFAFPSRYEGFGLPPLEAMAAGVPVVASAIPTSVEVLGSFAALPPVGDSDALAAALLQALTVPPDDATRTAAREHATSWTWQRCVDTTIGAYRQALG